MGKLDETLAALGRMPRPAPTRALGVRALELEGRTRIARGEHNEARAVLEAARDIARTSALDELAESLDAKVGICLVHQGYYEPALGKLEAALDAARRRGNTKIVAEVIGHIGLIHAARNNTSEALACYKEGLELAEARGMRSDLERWSGALGMLMTDLGDFRGAEERLSTALAIAEESDNRQGEAIWRGELGIRHFLAGDPEKAATALTRCLAIARDIGFVRYEAWAQIYLGAVGIERDLDKLEEASERIEAGLEIAHEIGNDELKIVGLLYLGRLRRAEGDESGARETLEQADGLATATQNLRLRVRVRAEMDGL
jgi:tetratricopeptide (TPR) repeat protein